MLFVIAGQPYYTIGLLLALHSAGAVAVASWLAVASWPAGRLRRAGVVAVAYGVNVVLSAVIALPLLPLHVLGHTPIPTINQVARDQVGWQRYVRQVADVYSGLSTVDRAGAAILTGNYGEYGALVRYGGRYGLPSVYSGQNQLWYLARPPDSARVVVVVGYDDDAWIAQRFASCTTTARLDNGVGVDNEEQGRPVRVCRSPRAHWRTLWSDFQHYD